MESSYPFPVSFQRLWNFCCGERAAVTKNAASNAGNGLDGAYHPQTLTAEVVLEEAIGGSDCDT